MEQCPCASGKEYINCCEPYLNGGKDAQTAEILMRSRYTAYIKTDIKYILATILPKSRKDIDEKSIKNWSEKTDWQKLEILTTKDGGIEDDSGIVEFIAHYKDKGIARKHHEIGKFKKIDGKWFYDDSEYPTPKQVVRKEPKVKRNDPCYCGSGKKYKKCCGKSS